MLASFVQVVHVGNMKTVLSVNSHSLPGKNVNQFVFEDSNPSKRSQQDVFTKKNKVLIQHVVRGIRTSSLSSSQNPSHGGASFLHPDSRTLQRSSVVIRRLLTLRTRPSIIRTLSSVATTAHQRGRTSQTRKGSDWRIQTPETKQHDRPLTSTHTPHTSTTAYQPNNATPAANARPPVTQNALRSSVRTKGRVARCAVCSGEIRCGTLRASPHATRWWLDCAHAAPTCAATQQYQCGHRRSFGLRKRHACDGQRRA